MTPKKTKILIIEDNENIAELIALYIKNAGFLYFFANNGSDALKLFKKEEPELVILDLTLPFTDGFKLLRELRELSVTPIIILSARAELSDKLSAFEAGVDDYITKPFEPQELIARIRSTLRRFQDYKKPVQTELSNISVDIKNRLIKYHGKKLNLPPREFELLLYFIKQPNVVFSREKLIDDIWGLEYMGETRAVDAHVKNLRKKLNHPNSWKIKTIWGIGYMFVNESDS